MKPWMIIAGVTFLVSIGSFLHRAIGSVKAHLIHGWDEKRHEHF